jgi:hypothetical protein
VARRNPGRARPTAAARCNACSARTAARGSGTKGGSLDEPPDLSAAIHIWTSRKLPGVIIPDGARQYPEEPD